MGKKFNVSLLATIMAVCSVLPGQAETVLKYGEGSPNRGAKAEALELFATQLNELTNGDLSVEFHWGGALLKWPAMLKGVSAGAVEMGTLVGAYNPKEMLVQGIGDLPVGEAADPWVGSRAMYDLMNNNADIIDAMAKQNVVYLGTIHTSAGQFLCNRAGLKSIDDLAGKKIRATGLYAKALTDFGASVVSTTFGDIYQSLDSGLLDCSLVYLYTIDPYKFWEVADQILLADWGQFAGVSAAINKDVWDGLSDDQKTALLTASSDLVDNQARLLIAQNQAALDALNNDTYGKNIEVINITADNKSKIDASAQKYVQEWIDNFTAEGYDGQAAFDEYTALVAKYTKERDEKGYPWAR